MPLFSTGSFPASHGMVSNSWLDREKPQGWWLAPAIPTPKKHWVRWGYNKGRRQRLAHGSSLFCRGAEIPDQWCHARGYLFPQSARCNHHGGSQSGCRHLGPMAAGWVTSSVYGAMPFIDQYAKAHPVKDDYGKTWTPTLPRNSYWYGRKKAPDRSPPDGWGLTFSPIPFAAKAGGDVPDPAFYEQWAASPFFRHLPHKIRPKTAVDSLGSWPGWRYRFPWAISLLPLWTM